MDQKKSNNVNAGKRTGVHAGFRRLAAILWCAGLIGIMTACADNKTTDGAVNRSGGKTTGVEAALQAGIEKSEGDGESAVEENLTAEVSALKTEEETATDVDLTRLSSTLVYSEVYNMMSKPDDYIGKTIKMQGIYSVYHDQETGMNYHACIIQDAAACCAQGMEFVLTDEYAYPQDYPEEGQMIAVVGVYDTYLEDDVKYCTLRDAVLVD